MMSQKFVKVTSNVNNSTCCIVSCSCQQQPIKVAFNYCYA